MTEQHYNALPAGYQLFEYEVEAVLGHGGFGITYLAWDRNLDKQVAIKEYLPAEFAVRQGPQSVRPRSTSDEGDYKWGLERFVKEAQTLALFRHPSIVPVYRFFEANGTAYMVMEYQKGQSLAELVRAHAGRFTEQELLSLLFPMLDGLAEVHKAGYLHRDVKPGNIFIREDGIPVLLDFGAARDAVGRKSKNLTSIVTPGYAPLEQYYADGNQGPWTDIYALAAIVHQAITGRIPPEAPARVKRDPYEPLAQVAAGKDSPAFLAAIDRALAVDEVQRPQTTAEWRDQLLGRSAIPAASSARPAETTQFAGDPATMVTHDARSGRVSQAPSMRTGPRMSSPAPIPVAEPKRGNGKLFAIVAGVVLLVGIGGAGAWYVVNNGDKLGLSTSNNDSRTTNTNTASNDARLREAEQEKQRQAESEKRRQAELDKQRQTEQDKQRQAESEKQRQAELDKQRLAEQERLRQAEQERLRQAELERQRMTDSDRLRQLDDQRRAEDDRRRLEDERLRQAEVERQRQAEAERQRLAEADRLRREDDDRKRQLEAERLRQAEVERQRQAEAERLRQAEQDKQRADAERNRRQEASRPTVMCPNSMSQLNSMYAPTDCLWVQRVFAASLSEQRIGVTSRWSNSRSGNTGTITVIGIVPGPGGQSCRRFRQTVTSAGQTREAIGVACIGANNAWVISG
ncbi:MAG: protein kinase [Alphaproteobacteria bacterium]